jgi:hypothetical protein
LVLDGDKRSLSTSNLFTHAVIAPDIQSSKMGGECSTYGEKRVVYGILVGKLGGKRPLGRPRRRWEDNIEMDFRKFDGRNGVD